jgi:hypothetical protein
MQSQNFKITQVFSNGSINFIYKSYKDSTTNCIFLDKDLKNFHFNLKKHKTLINNGSFLNYKNKFIKNR